MVIDREAVLKQAERLLRQGKLDGAIAEYVRLVADQPRDWSSVNALGDLYARAGRPTLAVEQYHRIADHLFAEEFPAKAAALYKKVLKTAPGDEHALLRLADIAARQELFADARAHLGLLAKQRRERGDETGALDCLVRLGSLSDADVKAQAAGGRAAETLHDLPRALELYKSAADGFAASDRRAEAIEALAAAVALAPSDHQLRARLVGECMAVGQLDRAQELLSSDAVGTDPDLLLLAARLHFASGRDAAARVALTRLLTVAPDHRDAVMALADEMSGADRTDSAYGCLEVVVDDAVLAGRWDEAIAVLRSFTARTPHARALQKLVEVTIDAGRQAATDDAQGRLAKASVETGLAGEGGVATPQDADRVSIEQPAEEFDLSDTLAALHDAAPPATVADGSSTLLAEAGAADAPPSLEEVFDGLRVKVTGDARVAEALDRFDLAIRHLEAGDEDQAIVELEQAARIPLLRFAAAARLGRLHLSRLEIDAGIEWLERAAAIPALDAEDGRAVLYDLAAALQTVGEGTRALAVLMEIEADAPGYRDVTARIAQLRTAGGFS